MQKHFFNRVSATSSHQFTDYPRTIFPAFSSVHMEFGFEIVPKGSQIPQHKHEKQEEIIYIQRGRLIARVGANERVCEEGDAVFIPKDTLHSFKTVEEDVYLTYTLSPPSIPLIEQMSK